MFDSAPGRGCKRCFTLPAAHACLVNVRVSPSVEYMFQGNATPVSSLPSLLPLIVYLKCESEESLGENDCLYHPFYFQSVV